MREGPVLIQGAMDVETELLISRLAGCEALTEGGYPFWRGKLGRQEAVVSRTGIGTVHTAAATALAVARFRPCVVLNQGVAGAHREDLHVGDVVVGERCVPIHDLITPSRARGAGMAPGEWAFHDHREEGEPEVFSADPAWAELLLKASCEGRRRLAGTLGSGDVFDRERDRILWLRERAGEDCEDMESIAAYRVCFRMGVPCAGVRIISNNELTGESYRRETGRELQRFLLDILEKL